MTISTSMPRLGRFAAAVAAVFLAGPSLAQTNPKETSAITNEQYVIPENTVDIGVEFGSGNEKDRARSGMFDGLRKHDVNGLLDFNYTNRAAGGDGRWLVIEGRNLGLDNREASARWRGLGDFNLKGEYSEITRHDPRTINSSLTGAGSTSPTVQFLAVPGTGTDQNFELKRKAYSLEGSKYFGNFQIEFNYKQENKDGERFWGKGFACNANYVASGACSTTGGTALLMLPEPVNSTIRQLDAKVNYSDGKLNLSAGYYGNYYTNDNGALTPNVINPASPWGNLNGGTMTDANLMRYMGQPMALWPDSQANQLFAAGNYRFTPKTIVNFKYSYTHATQNESFGGMGLSLGAPPTNPGLNAALGNTRGDLGGVLNSQKAQLGFATKPFDKSTLRGDIEYSSTDNKTPISFYNAQVASATPTYDRWTNLALSPKKWGAKLEGNYMLPQNYLFTAGVKWEHDDVGAWTQSSEPGGISALRQKSETLAYRGELRKTISDTLTGALSLNTSRTSGASSWLKPTGGIDPSVFNASQDCASATVGGVPNACVFSPTAQISYTQKNNETQKIRLNANWEPMDRLSVQGFYEIGNVQYHGPTTTSGLNWTRQNNFSLDASYAISQNWKVSAYYTNAGNKMFMGHSSDYDGTVWDRSQTFGAGLQGTPTDRLRIGGDLIWLHDLLRYDITPDVNASATTRAQIGGGTSLPDVKYELFRLKLWGDYAFDKASSIRLDYVYNRTFFNEWTYGYAGVPFLYTDNTTLSAKQTQSVNLFMARYVYKFQ